MRVIKVLNNSLVLALDNAGQESILMGKGIGFHKSIKPVWIKSKHCSCAGGTVTERNTADKSIIGNHYKRNYTSHNRIYFR